MLANNNTHTLEQFFFFFLHTLEQLLTQINTKKNEDHKSKNSNQSCRVNSNQSLIGGTAWRPMSVSCLAGGLCLPPFVFYPAREEARTKNPTADFRMLRRLLWNSPPEDMIAAPPSFAVSRGFGDSQRIGIGELARIDDPVLGAGDHYRMPELFRLVAGVWRLATRYRRLRLLEIALSVCQPTYLRCKLSSEIIPTVAGDRGHSKTT